MNKTYEWWTDELVVMTFWVVMAAWGLLIGVTLGALTSAL